MRIRVLWQGKTKNTHLRALAGDYVARIKRFNELVIEELAGARASHSTGPGQISAPEKRLLAKLGASTRVVLDPRGREWTSGEFAEWLGQQALRGTRELAFLVGGPEGFSEAFRKGAHLLLSLSPMTLTSDWARVLLLEQIYRAFTILRGYPYSR
jgi:23S rRNA (pseudouridine1915-N3)-methyltransferase